MPGYFRTPGRPGATNRRGVAEYRRRAAPPTGGDGAGTRGREDGREGYFRPISSHAALYFAVQMSDTS